MGRSTFDESDPGHTRFVLNQDIAGRVNYILFLTGNLITQIRLKTSGTLLMF